MTAWGKRNRVSIAVLAVVVAGCTTTGTAQPPQTARSSKEPALVKVDAAQAERLKNVMVPLLARMNRPLKTGEVRIGVMDDPHVNAANAGGGEFYVTTGLLAKADDDQLRAIMAHEIAHADLGHVAKLQRLGTGLSIGAVVLDQILPGSGALAPLAGTLIANAYTRKEEYEADAHGVTILKRGGYDGKQLIASTLTWLAQTEGTSQGGFFATHPATDDRIQAVLRLP